MKIEFLLDIGLMNFRENTDSFFYNTFKPTKEQSLQYYKLRRYEDLAISCIGLGLEKFDFYKLHKAGELCRNDYDIFDELKDYNIEDWKNPEK